MLALPAKAALDLVAAYDVDGVRGDTDDLRARMTKRELQAALDAMADTEDPFGDGTARFGGRGLWGTVAVPGGDEEPGARRSRLPDGAIAEWCLHAWGLDWSRDIRPCRSRERFLACWTHGHELERQEAAERSEAIADGVRESYAEVHVDAGLWSGRPRRWWRDEHTPGERKGLSGQALVGWVTAMAAKYPDNVRVS
jgi:hypothetical protein